MSLVGENNRFLKMEDIEKGRGVPLILQNTILLYSHFSSCYICMIDILGKVMTGVCSVFAKNPTLEKDMKQDIYPKYAKFSPMGAIMEKSI